MICPRCGTGETRKRGQNKNRQVWFCKTCGTRFIPKGKKTDPIANSLTLTKEYLTQAYEAKGMTTKEIGQETGINPRTVNYYLHRHNISVRGSRNYKHADNVEGFLKPSTDWHAYWLGFIAADGCIYKGNNNTYLLRLRLASKDREILENLKKGLSLDVPIKSFSTANGYGYTQLEVHSKPLIQALDKWGITENKTFSLVFPKIPQEHIHSFVRGYFDGDGTVYWRHRKTWSEVVCRFISGSLPFLEELNAYLISCNIKTNKIYKNGNGSTYVLPLSSVKQNVYNFALLIYKDASVFLERKYFEFQPLYEVYTK